MAFWVMIPYNLAGAYQCSEKQAACILRVIVSRVRIWLAYVD
jgi:hypothetical protein